MQHPDRAGERAAGGGYDRVNTTDQAADHLWKGEREEWEEWGEFMKAWEDGSRRQDKED